MVHIEEIIDEIKSNIIGHINDANEDMSDDQKDIIIESYLNELSNDIMDAAQNVMNECDNEELETRCGDLVREYMDIIYDKLPAIDLED